MKLPLIGITMSCNTEENFYFSKKAYAQSIAQAGGLPVLLPAEAALTEAAAYVQELDGIVFAGGGDIHPQYFKEELLDNILQGEMQTRRDELEIALYKEAEKRKLPMLGICRGIQLMAVAAGGSIWQDIDVGIKRVPEICHMQKEPDWCVTHRVKLVPGSRLAEIYRTDKLMTNTFHHQAVKTVPPGYRVSGRSDDGMVEAIEAEYLPFAVGVQWHPERVAAREEGTAELFRKFISSARDYAAKRERE